MPTEPCTRFFAPESAVIPPSVTIEPPPALMRWGRQALTQWNEPSSVIDSRFFHSSKLMSLNGVSFRTDAFSTRMSRRPKRFTALSTIAPTAFGSTMSAMQVSAWPPAARISCTTLSASSLAVRALTATAAPAWASASAIARPMLREAPVTSATLPVSSPETGVVIWWNSMH